MNCPACGASMPENASFCTYCGSRMENKEQQQTREQYTQPVYTAPVYEQRAQQSAYQTQMVDVSRPLTTGQVIGMMLLMCIPIVSIIMPFVWAFGENQNLNKKAFGKAVLIMWLIGIILSIVIGVAAGSAILSILDLI